MPTVDAGFAAISFKVYVDGAEAGLGEPRVSRVDGRFYAEYRVVVEPGKSVTVLYQSFTPKMPYRMLFWGFTAVGGGVDISERNPSLPRRYRFTMPSSVVRVVLWGQLSVEPGKAYLLVVTVWLEPPKREEEKPAPKERREEKPEEKPPEGRPEERPAPSPVPAVETPSVRVSRMSAVAGGALAALLLLAALAAAKHR